METTESLFDWREELVKLREESDRGLLSLKKVRERIAVVLARRNEHRALGEEK